MTRISRPIFVMALVAAIVFAAALALSTLISSAERPIETGAPGAAIDRPLPIERH
jgi:hypothetical protein